MAEKKPAQAQQSPPLINPWQDMMTQHLDRMAALYEEVGRVENEGLDLAHKNIEESARLTRASFDYAMELSAQWRKISLEATRQTFQMMTHPWQA